MKFIFLESTSQELSKITNFYLFWTSISKVVVILMQFDNFLVWALTKYGHVT